MTPSGKDGEDVGLKEKDEIAEAVQIMRGIRDLCIIFEEGKDIPRSAYIVLIAAIERAVGILEDTEQTELKGTPVPRDVPTPDSLK